MLLSASVQRQPVNNVVWAAVCGRATELKHGFAEDTKAAERFGVACVVSTRVRYVATVSTCTLSGPRWLRQPRSAQMDGCLLVYRSKGHMRARNVGLAYGVCCSNASVTSSCGCSLCGGH